MVSIRPAASWACSSSRPCARSFSSASRWRADETSSHSQLINGLASAASSPPKPRQSTSLTQRLVTAKLRDERYQALRRSKTQEELAKEQNRNDFEAQKHRTFVSGDVYAPHDLSSAEQRKWSRYGKHRDYITPEQRGRKKVDKIDVLKINPVDEYKNFAIMSEYIRSSGKIMPMTQTGLTRKNQTKMAKAIRRARGMGLLPTVHKHPIILNRDHASIHR